MNAIKSIQQIIGLPAWRFIIGLLAVVLNIGLTFFFYAIVGDGYVTHKQAFFIAIPFIIVLPIYFARSFVWYYKKEQHFNFLDLMRFVMLLFSIFQFAFNAYMWLYLL